MNAIVYWIVIAVLRRVLSDELQYEETGFIYNDSPINMLLCNSKSTKSLIALMCPSIQKAFITTPSYFSLVLLFSMNLTIASQGELIIISDSNFNSIDSYDDMILVSSTNYFYLFKSITQFKKIKFPFDALNTKASQAKLFDKYICANVKLINYPYTNYIYLLYFNYTSNAFSYISMDAMYQLPSILQFSLISFQIDYCYNFLNIPTLNLTSCVMISDYNILNKGIGDSSNIYVFQITASEVTNIKLSIVNKLQVPYSCGYKMLFLKEMVLFSCPLYKGIAYCKKGINCNANSMTIISSKSVVSTAGFDISLVYEDMTQQNSLVAIGDSFDGRVYLINVRLSQFGGVSNNTINALETYYSIYYAEELFGWKYFNPFIEVMIIYDGSRLFVWNSIEKSEKYAMSYPTSGEVDSRVFLKTILKTVYCTNKSYYDKEKDNCIECPVKEVSKGFSSATCSQCSATDDYSKGYYCHDYCPSKKFGSKCVSCESFLKSFLFSDAVDFSNELTYSSDDAHCEFYCPKGKVALEKKCIDETVYPNNNEILLSNNTVVVQDHCVSYLNCYSCYQQSECSWCENTNVCMSTSSKRNCTVSSSKFNGQYKCLPDSSIQTYSNENKIALTLASIDIKQSDQHIMLIYFFSYTHYTKVKLSLSIHQNGVLTDLRLFDYLTEKTSSIDTNISSYSKIISLQGVYVMMTLPPSVVSDKSLFNLITMSIEVITKEFSKEAIIGIVFGCIAFITLVISLICLIKKRQRDKLKEIIINQRIHNYNPVSSHSNSQTNIPNPQPIPADKESTKQLKLFIEKRFKDDNARTAYLKKELMKYPSFALNQSFPHLAYYTCAFCDLKFSANCSLRLLDCDHIFHAVCLEQQLISSEKYCCLVCNSPIISMSSSKNKTTVNLSSTVLSEKGGVL